MKNIIFSAGICALSAISSQAAVIVFTDANAQEASVVGGVLGAITEPADNSVLTSLTYTVSGLTIDADGSNNDTVTFIIAVSPLGVGNVTWDQNGGGVTDVREFDYDNLTFNDAGEGIAFGAITVSGISSGGQSYALNSGLYKGLTFRRWTSDTVDVVGDVTSLTASNTNPLALNDTFFSVERNTGNWNLQYIDFTVDVGVVPEPSTTTLLGLGGLALILRRRK